MKTNLIPLYKAEPPFMDFTSGYGYLGVILQDINSGKIQCHLCGKLFKGLNTHLFRKHEINSTEYKEKTGLNKTTPLCSSNSSKKRRESYFSPERKESVLNHLKDMREKQKSRSVEKKQEGYNKSKFSGRVQRKNLTGTCDLQAKHLFWTLYRKYNGIPPLRDNRKLENLAITRFGTYEKAMLSWGISQKEIDNHEEKRIYNFKKLREENNFFPKYSKEIVINQVKQFYDLNKRIFTWSEAKNLGLPSPIVFKRITGTFKQKDILKLINII
tara:strand:- start:1604 stop:2416 length:813 start_codon:yes stop_codon:yes gene_type:complete